MVAVSLVASFLLPTIVLALPGTSTTSKNAHRSLNGSNGNSGHSQAALANDALTDILTRGAPILGTLFMLYVIALE